MMGILVLARSKWKYGVAFGLLLWTGALLFHSANSINVASPHLENSVTTADENEVFEKQYDEDRSVDPSNYFSGALPRPVIEIVKPQHGEELQLNEVKILVEVKDYDLPSPLHDTKMCIGLADGQTKLFEKCFDQLKIMDFFVSGMEPGEYQLRAALTEKGEALAVAMRAFTIVGVPVPGAGPDGGEARVSLRTALEVALDHHQQGQHSLAETVYQRIVDLFPHHGDALHLLGIIHYQKGDPAGAIDLLERAVAAVNLGNEGTGLDAALAQALNQLDHSGGAGSGGDGEGPPSASSEQQANFHNSLGECLRAVGRVRESLEHYRRAIELRPRFFLAIYNLGLAMQQLGDLNQAAALYMKHLHNFIIPGGESSKYHHIVIAKKMAVQKLPALCNPSY